MSIPVPLEPGEQLLVHGDPGGLGFIRWYRIGFPVAGLALMVAVLLAGLGFLGHPVLGVVLALVSGPIALVVVVVALAWPVVRSTRFWVTNRRLLVKPRRGKLQETALTDIDFTGIQGHAFWQSLRVPAGDRQLVLRYVKGAAEAWGTMLMARAIELWDFESGDEVRVESVVAWWGVHRKGVWARKGVVVLRPDYLAFLPATLDEAGVARLAGDVAALLVGVTVLRMPPVIMWDRVFYLLQRGPESQYDETVQLFAAGFGGMLLDPDQVEVVRDGERVTIELDEGSLRLDDVTAPQLDEVLAAWEG